MLEACPCSGIETCVVSVEVGWRWLQELGLPVTVLDEIESLSF